MMIDKDKLTKETEYLFNRDFNDELTEEESEALEDRAHNLIKTYGWPKVFEAWDNYLHEKCITPEAAVNFANLFWWYGGQDHPIPEPHKFLAYFYYVLDYQTQEYDSDNDILDSLSTHILSKAGYSEADLFLNPYYDPVQDPKIIAEVESLRKQNA